MKRRWLLYFLGLFASSSSVRAVGDVTPLKVAEVGPWKFSVPEEWIAHERDSHTYLESSDGRVGCYIKSFEPPVTKQSAQAFANEIQAIHEAAFRKGTKGNWRLMEQSGTARDAQYLSHLDMLDEKSKYRVLSLVLAGNSDALQITIHNYLCEDYSATRNEYQVIEESMHRVQPEIFAESLLILAGFVFAHAAWSASDLPKGELLVPLAIVENSGQRRLLRFEAESQKQAIAEGKAELARQDGEIDSWAFAWEGQFNEGGVYVDVLTIEAKSRQSSQSVVFVQRFQPYASGKFKLIDAPSVSVGGKALPEAEAKVVLAQLQAGVQTHARAAEHWREWSAP